MADDSTSCSRGDGLNSGISVSLTDGTLPAIQGRVDERGISAQLGEAAQHQIERDNLDELLADFESVNGPADPAAVAIKQTLLTRAASAGADSTA
ncbi:hypothetical protein [Streptomyces xanthochromogenes]|uniref:hypothetical protein n=1 Tax=Streptomyces xanthochromogenes TaxID=67384 RepID=UPI002F414C91